MMEMSDDREKFPLQNRPEEDHINYPPSSGTIPSNWGFPGSNLTATSSMVDPYNPNLWGQATNSQNLGFPDLNVHNTPLLIEGVVLPGIVPPGLSQLSTDSAFIERAARFSSFNGGNLCDMMSPLKIAESTNLFCHRVPESDELRLVSSRQSSRDVSLSVDRTAPHGVSPTNNKRKSSDGLESDEAEFSGGGGEAVGEPSWEPSSPKGLISSKKWKRGGKKSELDRAKGAVQENEEMAKDDMVKEQKGNQEITPTTTNKAMMKQGKQGSQALNQVKEEYIHVRARRGQATNSHSLAERVRREKISERMKFLQDLVPGCSKVTGKAVMLDEIISYVQSLQRQVEFLSMKLATVNPWTDLNIEGLQAKNIFQSRPGPSALLGFSPDVPTLYSSLNQSHHGLIPTGLHRGSSDILRQTINSQLNPMLSGFKDPSQISKAWQDELHHVVQMRFNGSLPPENTKVEL